jgi:hypothetical protein
MEKYLLAVLIVSSLCCFASCGGGFRCYVGSGSDPAALSTIYLPPSGMDSEERCFRYEEPTCSGCTINCTAGQHCECWHNCDLVSIQNATFTWRYGALSAGVCSDIPNHWAQFTYYRNALCCRTDLCNYPINSATSNMASFVTFLYVIIHAMIHI